MRTNRLGFVLVAVLMGMTFSMTIHASVMYTYTGNPFVTFTDNSPPAGAYTNAEMVSGWFEVDTALGNNLALGNITGLPGFGFSFSDGRKTVTNASPGLILNNFQVGTDAVGNIDEWLIQIGFSFDPLVVGSQSASILSDGETGLTAATQDRGAIQEVTTAAVPGQSGPVTSLDAGQNRLNPGTWETTGTVPVPGPLALIGLGLVAMGYRRARKNLGM